ncbi:hypothetical protein FRC10_003906 [Ceratobasidium sp. 414]|nr:hypothetical protein FRC10_003906 [Ceratobasidium sp. 414]
MYQGLFNSSYVPTQLELAWINNPVNILGPWFCSAVFSLLLNGIILAQVSCPPPLRSIRLLILLVSPQTYNYAEQQNKDPPHLRFLVYFSFLLCIAKSADTLSITYVKQLQEANPRFTEHLFSQTIWRLFECNATIAWGCFIGLLVQSYFICRTFMLSGNWYFLVIASLAALGGFTASIIVSVMISDPNEHYASPYLIVANMMVFGTVLADGLITGFTCFYFLKQSKMTVFSGTKELLARLTAVSMQSAVPPLICLILVQSVGLEAEFKTVSTTPTASAQFLLGPPTANGLTKVSTTQLKCTYLLQVKAGRTPPRLPMYALEFV